MPLYEPSSGALTIKDEGSSRGTATTLDFTGSSVTASVANNTATITVTGGGSLAIGDTVTNGTESNILFIGSNSALSQTSTFTVPQDDNSYKTFKGEGTTDAMQIYAKNLRDTGSSTITTRNNTGAAVQLLTFGSNKYGTDGISQPYAGQLVQWFYSTSDNAVGKILARTNKFFFTQQRISNGSDLGNESVVLWIEEQRIGVGHNNANNPPANLFNVGSEDQFQVDNTGNIKKINNVTTSFPSSQGGANTYLKNNGSGTLSWESVSSGLSDVKSEGVSLGAASSLNIINGAAENPVTVSSGVATIDLDVSGITLALSSGLFLP